MPVTLRAGLSFAAVALIVAVVACTTTPSGTAKADIEVIPNPDASTAPALTEVVADEGFTFSIPGGAPQPVRKTVTIPAGDVATAAWSTATDNARYSISMLDYPQQLVASNPPGAFLVDGRNGLVGSVKGTIKSESDFKFDDKYPGKEFVVGSEAGDLHARTFLVGARQYTQFVLYSPNLGEPPEGKLFFDSLKLVNPPEPIPYAAPDAGTGMGSADGGMAMDSDAGMSKPDAGTKPRKKK